MGMEKKDVREGKKGERKHPDLLPAIATRLHADRHYWTTIRLRPQPQHPQKLQLQQRGSDGDQPKPEGRRKGNETSEGLLASCPTKLSSSLAMARLTKSSAMGRRSTGLLSATDLGMTVTSKEPVLVDVSSGSHHSSSQTGERRVKIPSRDDRGTRRGVHTSEHWKRKLTSPSSEVSSSWEAGHHINDSTVHVIQSKQHTHAHTHAHMTAQGQPKRAREKEKHMKSTTRHMTCSSKRGHQTVSCRETTTATGT